MSALWRTIMVQMFIQDLKKVSAFWSVRFRVSALERFCDKGFLRNSSGTNFFVRLGEMSALEDVRFREVLLYFRKVALTTCLRKTRKGRDSSPSFLLTRYNTHVP